MAVRQADVPGVADGSASAGTPGTAPDGQEDTSARTGSTSTFLNDDGTKTMRVYPRPVHFQKPDGTWADIDTNFITGAGGRWSEKANSQQASFAAGADDPALITLQIDANHQISYGLQGAASRKGTAQGDTLTYPSAAPSTDLVYNGLASGIKETLLLHDASAPTSWVFPLHLTGLTASLNANGNVEFKDDSGAVLVTMPRGIMEDAAKDPHSGLGAMSDGVTYQLTTVNGSPALQMSVDSAWLHDAKRVFPVQVDPTTAPNLSAGQSTWVMSPFTANNSHLTDLRVGTYDSGTNVSNSYITFPAVSSALQNDFVEQVKLHVDALHSWDCNAHPLYVSQIASQWDPASINTYPGLTVGQQLGTNTISLGDTCGGVSWETISLGGKQTDPGSQLVNSWAHGGTNWGLALTAPATDSTSWKIFASAASQNPPYLEVTYADWAADYSTANTYVSPTALTNGSQQITMTNLAANWWSPSSMQVKPRFFDANWNEQWPAGGYQPATPVPGTVTTGSSVTFTATIPAFRPGQTFQMCWDGYVNGTMSLHDVYGVMYNNCTWVSTQNIPPQIDAMTPLGSSVLGTVTPQLAATGHDPDNYPGTGLTYYFKVYDTNWNLLTQSNWQSGQTWQVPAGVLNWNSVYYWNAWVSDGPAQVPGTAVAFSTQVQQPPITSHLGTAASDGQGHSFDPQVGNYTTSVTDASVKAVGPALGVVRSYNSLDPRTTTLFGAGWTSVLDMRVQADADGSNSVVLTDASGRTERLGQNAGGQFVPASGEFETLSLIPNVPGYSLLLKNGVRYDFETWVNGGFALTQITDAAGHKQVLYYDGNFKLSSVADAASGHTLHVTWTGDGRHVASVSTDALGGTQGSLTWTYSYNSAHPDELDQVCAPAPAGNSAPSCTTYNYAQQSHMRTATLDAGPTSYWRLGEFGGTTAGSEIIQNQGNDNAQYSYSGVTLAQGGPVPGSPSVAASFDGKSGVVVLPAMQGDINSYTSVALWFRTNSSGVLYSYQTDSFPAGSTGNNYTPALYVGSSGKLHGEFWQGYPTPITSANAVNDGKWHFAVLTAQGGSQTMYLDGAVAGTATGAVVARGQRAQSVGGGFIGGGWPDEPFNSTTDNTGHAWYFNGSISDVSLYGRSLGQPAVSALWQAGSQISSDLSGIKLPSGKSALSVSYDGFWDRANQVTDANGGTYKISSPSVSGSSQEYRGQVMSSVPSGYWRLSDSSGTQAANQVYVPRPTPENGTYANVTLGGPGPMTGSAGAATFDGKTSSVQLPASMIPTQGPSAVAVWFKTTGAGTILGYQDGPIDVSPTQATSWNPALFVGADGHLQARLWNGANQGTLSSPGSVADGKWHFAVLTADSTNSQNLYLDGQLSSGPAAGTIGVNGSRYLYLGAGNEDGWTDSTTTPFGHFNGQLANAAIFPHGITAGTVSSLYTQATTQSAAQGVNAGSPSAYDAAIVSAHPSGYWRLDDTSGNQASDLISSAALAQNRGTEANTTGGATGPWASGTATATSFNGTSSSIQLPPTAIPKPNTGSSVSLWFKTAAPGVLYSYQNFPLGQPGQGQPGVAGMYNPALYVGSDNKLHGALSATSSPAVSAATVTDNAWHYAVLTSTGTTEQLYLDGQASGAPITLAATYNGSGYAYLGAGTIGGGWPAAPADGSGHFNGALADFAIYGYPLAPATIAGFYPVATTAAGGNGLDAAGAFRAMTVQSNPVGYWRLDDPAGSGYAADELGTALPDTASGTYTSTTLNTSGPSGDPTQTAATFNGTTSALQLPASAAPTKGAATIELWFKTTSAGTLYGYQDFPLGAPHSQGANSWNPALYIGTDNKVHGEFWTGSANNQLTSANTVTDGNWHQVALTADSTGQSLYIDGNQSATTTSAAPLIFNGTPYVYLGAGTSDGSWPNAATANGYLNGSIAEASYYPTRLAAGAVSSHYTAMRNGTANPIPMTTTTVTDPGNNTLTYKYDTHTARLTSYADAYNHTTSYTYDTNGFLYTVTDPDGHTVTTGHDARGNTVSRTTCQSPSSCHTSYATYYLDTSNALNLLNDTMLTSSDARSSGPGDTTYRTSYTYNSAGQLTSTVLPATPDFPKGRISYTSYTTGSETAPGGGNEPPGLPAATTTVLDAAAYPTTANLNTTLLTQYQYDSHGNLAQSTAPSGLATTYTYDPLGRPATQTVNCTNCGQGQTASTATTTYTWDGWSNPLTQSGPATTDAVTGTVHTPQTTTAYDADGNKTSQTTSDTTGGDQPRTTNWAYTSTDRVQQVTDPAGHTTSYTYDAYGHTATTTDAAGTTQQYVYSPQGWLQQTAITNYTGNPNNPVAAHWQVTDSRSFDPAGRLATDTDAMGRTTHTYYNDDNTIAEIDLDGFHNFNTTTQQFDGTTRNVVLQTNTYDAAGQLTQRVTGGGKTTVVNAYDAASRPTSTTLDPGGLNRVSSNTYDAAGDVLSSKLTDGTTTRETDSTYDTSGDVLTQTVVNSPQNSVTTHTYDQRGLVLTTTSPNGNASGATPAAYTTTYFHDQVGQSVITDAPPTASTTFNTTTGQPVTLPAAAAETRTGYNTFGEPTETKDPLGNITTTTHTFDSNGEHLSAAANSYTTPGGATTFTAVTQTDYDALGRPAKVTDPKGNVTTSKYDQLGNLVESDLPALAGSTPKWLYSYDLDGEKQSITDPTGALTLSTYDDLGRAVTLSQQVRQTSHTGTAAAAMYTGTFVYDDAGNRTGTYTPNHELSTSGYDASGAQTSVTDALGNTTTTTHDLTGAPIKVTEPADAPGGTGRSTVTTYDQAGRAIGTAHLDTTGATLSSTAVHYDADGNPVSATDADGNTSTATFDALGRPTQQVQPIDATHSITTAFGYDAAGHRTDYHDGNGHDTYTTYNTLGLPESVIEPATSAYPNPADRTYTTAYDQDSHPVTVTEPGGIAITRTYDAAGRVTGQSGTGGEAPTPTRTFGYDFDGRTTSLSTPSGTQSYTYDDRGNLWTSSGPLGNASMTYNQDGKLATRTDAVGTTTYGYDPAGHLKTLADPLTGASLSYAYYPSGMPQSVNYGNGTTRSFTYDGQHNLTADTLASSTGTEASLSYGYDAAGRLKSQTTTGLAGAPNNTYTYDQAGRLASWNNGTTTNAYGYDANGNLTQSGSTTAAYNERNQLTNAGTTNYTYTARGTRSAANTGMSTTSATYDAYDELTSQGSQTYTYDALGRLTGTAGRTFSYDDTTNNLTSDGAETYTRTPGGGLVGIGASGTSALAYTDRHGNLVGTFTPTGTALLGSTAYDPWGKPTGTTGTTNHLGYQGDWTDPTTGQVNTASRWYDPSTADFTSRDTAPVGGNLYAYANDDPLSLADPSGHSSCVPGSPEMVPQDPGTVPDTDPVSVPDNAPTPVSVPKPRGLRIPGWVRTAAMGLDMVAQLAQALQAENRERAEYDSALRGEIDQFALQNWFGGSAGSGAWGGVSVNPRDAVTAAAGGTLIGAGIGFLRSVVVPGLTIATGQSYSSCDTSGSSGSSGRSGRSGSSGHSAGHPAHLSVPKIDLSTLTASHAFDGIVGTATQAISNGLEVGATNTATAIGNAAAVGASSFIAQSMAAEQSPGLGITTFPGSQSTGVGTTLDNPGDPNAGAGLTLDSPLIPLAGLGNVLINPAVLQLGHILQAESVYRGDGRSPDDIKKAGGFMPQDSESVASLLDYASDIRTKSRYVGTSKSSDVAATYFGGQYGYVYEITGMAGGIDVNKELGPFSPSPHEKEIVFDGGIPWEYVTRVWKKDEWGEVDFDYDEPIWER
ncbi:LamG-like jellyroll fold domain-containing protein [Kitasatospora kifunensis]|uniref:RHS repeat-associated protein n=1 Tax=Kitasatospora kifunensis TaxID=58351 RepID=A0A7W7QXX8_KITKI|nr:LamG-like jellyroll fold domain-containing protein [Kitasatospora kifunensis]MBB4921574.1 RHS repeat-associated protein [Kitasatospora kifunensis]